MMCSVIIIRPSVQGPDLNLKSSLSHNIRKDVLDDTELCQM